MPAIPPGGVPGAVPGGPPNNAGGQLSLPSDVAGLLHNMAAQVQQQQYPQDGVNANIQNLMTNVMVSNITVCSGHILMWEELGAPVCSGNILMWEELGAPVCSGNILMWEELGGTRVQQEYTDVGRAGGPVCSGNILMWEGLGDPCAAGIY